MNNSLTRSAYYENNPVYLPENLVRIINPLSRDLDVMRQTLLYGGLETLAYNQNRKAENQKLFEYGNVYRKISPDAVGLDSYPEEKHLAVIITGKKNSENWNSPAEKADFYYLKAYVHNILKRTGTEASALKQDKLDSPFLKEGMQYTSGGRTIVAFGTLSSALLRQFDLRQEVFYADFCWDNLLSVLSKEDPQVKELPKFPEVRRDLALVLDKQVRFEEIRQVAFQTEKNILREVGLFDVYEGDKIEAGKKSYAIYCILADDRKTLTDNEIEKTMNKLIRSFEGRVGAKIRGAE
jgi:phenylalanyl-tRNA synthetase beta chain